MNEKYIIQSNILVDITSTLKKDGCFSIYLFIKFNISYETTLETLVYFTLIIKLS